MNETVKAAYLLALDVRYTPDDPNAYTNWKIGSDLIQYSPRGNWIETASLYRFNRELPAELCIWGTSEPQVYRCRVAEYDILLAVTAIDLPVLPGLLSGSEGTGTPLRDAFQSLFSSLAGTPTKSYSPWRRFSCCVFVEPNTEYIGATEEDMVEWINSVLPSFDMRLDATIVHDLVVMTHGLQIDVEFMLAVRLRPLKIPGGDRRGRAHISKSIVEYCQLLGIVEIVRHANERLTSLPFYVTKIESYVNEIATTSILNNVEGRYLADLLVVDSEYHDAMDILEAIDEYISNAYVRLERDGSSITHIDGPNDSPYSSSRWLGDVNNYLSERKKLARSLAFLKSRKEAFVSIVSEAASIGATQSNLKLNKSVRVITFVACALAFMSIVTSVLTSFLTDRNKEDIQCIAIRALCSKK